MPAVDLVSVYDETNAGVRARGLDWLRRHRVPSQLTSYFQANAAGAQQFVRHPRHALSAEYALRALLRRGSSTLFLSREASPLSKGDIEEQLLAHARHGVYDIDDALHHDVRGTVFERFFSKGTKAVRAARAADVVIAGNAYLADWASSMNREVVIVPTCVEPRDYLLKSVYDLSDPPRLVWVGTPSGEDYLLDIAAALLQVHRMTGARLTVIGAGGRHLGELEPLVDRVPWRLELVHESLEAYDVGLMPLRDKPYERGKCAYKLLEYGAAGLPFVGSPVGANAEILRDTAARAPRTIDEWVDALCSSIFSSVDERRAQGLRQRAIIEQNFSFERWSTTWRRAMFPHLRTS